MTLHPLAPWWLLVVLLLPLLALTLWQARLARQLGAGSPWPWLRRAAIVLVLAVIGVGPATTRVDLESAEAGVDVFFVVDQTGSMAAEDYDGTNPRLDGVRHDVISITDDIPGARFSVIGFDSQASRQLPLTTDTRAIDSWAQTVHQEVTAYSLGSLTDRPLDELDAALRGAQERRPNSVRIVYFLSDGEQTTTGTPESYAELAPLIDGGAVLGYGTAAGGRMRDYPQHNAEKPDYIQIRTDGAWVDAVSHLDEESLRVLAGQLGVPYVHRAAPTPTDDLTDGIDTTLTSVKGERTIKSYNVVVWPAALVLVVLLTVECACWATATRRSMPRRSGGHS